MAARISTAKEIERKETERPVAEKMTVRGVIFSIMMSLLLFAGTTPAQAASYYGDSASGEGGTFLIALLIACAISLAICLVIRGKNKTVHKGVTATPYEIGPVHLTRKDDRYTHTTRTVRHMGNNQGGGGSRGSGPGGPGYGGHGPGGFGGPGGQGGPGGPPPGGFGGF